MDQPSSITPLATVVLTLLSEHPMHPYEATYHFHLRHTHDYVKARTGSLYHTFEQLQRRGLIEPIEVERSGRRPERTVYRITEAGRTVLEESVRRLVSEPVNEYTSFEAGLVTIAHLSRGDVVRSLRERAIRLRARAAEHHSILQDHLGMGLPHLFVLEIDYQVDHCAAQAVWCDRTAAAIERGEIAWPDLEHLPRETGHLLHVDEPTPRPTRAARADGAGRGVAR